MKIRLLLLTFTVLSATIFHACKKPSEVLYDEYCQPQQELCNGIDEDCDGKIDENYDDLGEPCTVGRGNSACERDGMMVCSPNKIQTTCGAVPGDPQIEACNGFDDDCDGVLDETFLGIGSRCKLGIGACFQSSNWTCKEDGSAKQCPVSPPEPTDELCNGIDDDCDGSVDEGFLLLGSACFGEPGQCRQRNPGIYQCSDDGMKVECCIADPAAPGSCLDLLADATPETCDRRDNDCDGTIDENAMNDTVEECDGIDNDCDGTIDENVEDATPEQCDGIDNDCDGTADEGLGLNVGNDCEYNFGDRNCQSIDICNLNAGMPELVCIEPVEICDQQDNDCDGAVDEDAMINVAEFCDGIDNDCDGSADEDFDRDNDGIPFCPIECLERSGAPICDLAMDCDDNNNAIWGGPAEGGQIAEEICQDTIDQDCDGRDPACSPPSGRIFRLRIASDREASCPDVNGDGSPDNAFLPFREAIDSIIETNYIDAENARLLIATLYPYSSGMVFESTTLNLLLGNEIIAGEGNNYPDRPYRFQIDLENSINDEGNPNYQYQVSVDESGHFSLLENGRISVSELGLDMYVTKFEGDISLVSSNGNAMITPGIEIENGILAGILSEDQYQRLRTRINDQTEITLNLDSDVEEIITDDGPQQGYSICLSYQFTPIVTHGWTPEGWNPFE